MKDEIFFPLILRLKLNRGELGLENGAYDKVKEYSNNFIEYFINNENKSKKSLKLILHLNVII